MLQKDRQSTSGSVKFGGVLFEVSGHNLPLHPHKKKKKKKCGESVRVCVELRL